MPAEITVSYFHVAETTAVEWPHFSSDGVKWHRKTGLGI